MAAVSRDSDYEEAPSSRYPGVSSGSGPASGTVGPTLFSSDSGPGYWTNEDEVVSISFEGDVLPASKVVRFGPEGLWFVRSLSNDYRFHTRVRVHLTSGDWTVGPLAARIVPLDARASGPLLGLKLAALSTPVARQILSKFNQLVAQGKARPAVTGLPLKEEILEPQRISALLSTLAGTEEWGHLIDAKDVQIRVETVTQEGLVQWRVNGPLPQRPLTAELRGYNSLYRIHLSDPRPFKDGVITSLPARVERLRHRWHRRGKVDGREWTVEFLHPLWDLAVIRRELRDVSFGGICFACNLDEDLILPGLRLPLLKVLGPDGLSVQLNGQVRFIQPAQGDQPAICGLSVQPSLPEDEDAWTQLVLQMLNINTSSGSEWTEDMWALFTESGYFNLSGKTPGEFDELKRNFVAVAERTSAEVRLSCQAVWPSERGVEASCSVIKAYQSSWILHQVAKRRGQRVAGRTPHVLREIYLRSFEHAQADPSFRWAICYCEANVPWMRRSHVAFAERHEQSERAMALPFRLMEAVCAERGEVGPRRFEIGTPTTGECSLLLSTITESRPTPYREALDLVPSRMRLDGVGNMWGQAALERGRTLMVARRGATAVAVAVLETGEVGTNLFRLLDSVRLFPLTRGGHEAYPALLEAAKTWFAERGRESFIYFWEELHHGEHVALARLRDLGEGRFWACSADLVPEFLEHVFEQTARRNTLAVPAGQVVSIVGE